MSWFRLDDQGAFHAKVIAAGNEAYGAWCRAGQWSSLHGTEGKVPRATALTIAKQRVWDRLVTAGLCESLGDEGWLIHDFLDYNPSAEEVRAKREARAEAGRRGGRAKAESNRNKPPRSNVAIASDDSGKPLAKVCPDPDPDPDPGEKKEDPPVVPPETAERPEGVTINLWRMHGEGRLFIDAYERAVRHATKNQRWALRRPDDLRRVLESSCLGNERRDIEGWIDRHVRELVTFVRGLPADEKTYWKDVGPAEMQRWFNLPERGLTLAASQPQLRDSKTRLRPTSAEQSVSEPPTPEELAAFEERMRQPPKVRQLRSPAVAAADQDLTPAEAAEIERRRQDAVERLRELAEREGAA